MKDRPEDRKYEIQLYWKLLKISKEHIDNPTENPEEDLYHLFAFSQIVSSMKEKLRMSKYTKFVTDEERYNLFGNGEKAKDKRKVEINTATFKICRLSDSLRHYAETQSDSRHFDVKVNLGLGLAVTVGNENSNVSTVKQKDNPTKYENNTKSYLKILANKKIDVPRETFYQCYEELKVFMNEHFELE